MMASAFTITMILMQLAIAFCYDMDHALARGSPDGFYSGSTDPPTYVASGGNLEDSCDI
jgi:hypothetical protein